MCTGPLDEALPPPLEPEPHAARSAVAAAVATVAVAIRRTERVTRREPLVGCCLLDDIGVLLSEVLGSTVRSTERRPVLEPRSAMSPDDMASCYRFGG
jgi:hypothetical protein